MAEARIEDLEALYKELERSMTDTDAMISQVDNAFNNARQEWKSKGADQFDQDWNGTFKPTLIKLTQTYAAAGSDVAFQHNKFAEAAKEADMHPQLPPMNSPR
jgi:uncharacterized protein YukE